MGLVRSPSLRSEEYLEGIIEDYVNGKGAKRTRGSKRSAPRLVAALTCLQLAFAIYATFLLYYMSPVDQWKHFMVTPRMPSQADVCEHEEIDFEQKKSDDATMIRLKRELYDEILEFQQRKTGSETLPQLMRMKKSRANVPKITVLLNHFKRKTLCAQLNSLLNQTLPFHHVWVLSFGSPKEASLRRIVERYNSSRISFISSSYDFKYYGRFQMALQTESDFVYIVDDDMIPFRQNDFTFPSYRKLRTKETGLYLPDPAYGITVDRIVQVDFLSSSWFLSSDLVKTLFVEAPFTFMTGEDLHLRYNMIKTRIYY